MSPGEFLDQIVAPNVADFHANPSSMRHAWSAVSTADALAAHIYAWCKSNAPALVTGINDDSHYRATLAARNSDFALLRDIAKAQKHVHLDRGNPQVANAEQVTSRAIGYGEGPYGEGRYGGCQQVVVDVTPTEFRYVEAIVAGAVGFLKSEMTRLGL